MHLLQPHWRRSGNENSGNENSGRSNSPPSCTVSSQKESEEESKNSPSQRPHRAGTNYGPPSACAVNKPMKARGARKMAAEDDEKEKGP
eukprot:4817519-Ditylum_brightwellii.AAC.1